MLLSLTGCIWITPNHFFVLDDVDMDLVLNLLAVVGTLLSTCGRLVTGTFAAVLLDALVRHLTTVMRDIKLVGHQHVVGD